MRGEFDGSDRHSCWFGVINVKYIKYLVYFPARVRCCRFATVLADVGNKERQRLTLADATHRMDLCNAAKELTMGHMKGRKPPPMYGEDQAPLAPVALAQSTELAISNKGDDTKWRSAHASAGDPSLVVPVIASPQEILRAQALRQELRRKYLNRPDQSCGLWWVGVD